MLERISEEKIVTKETTHQNFSLDNSVNNLIKSGQWKSLADFDHTWTAAEIIEVVTMYYDIDNHIGDTIEIQYKTYVKPREYLPPHLRKTRVVPIPQNCHPFDGSYAIRSVNLTTRNITVADVYLKCRKKVGMNEIIDVTCDSTYMMKAMELSLIHISEPTRPY